MRLLGDHRATLLLAIKHCNDDYNANFIPALWCSA
jgi:hypothetical protein